MRWPPAPLPASRNCMRVIGSFVGPRPSSPSSRAPLDGRGAMPKTGGGVPASISASASISSPAVSKSARARRERERLVSARESEPAAPVNVAEIGCVAEGAAWPSSSVSVTTPEPVPPRAHACHSALLSGVQKYTSVESVNVLSGCAGPLSTIESPPASSKVNAASAVSSASVNSGPASAGSASGPVANRTMALLPMSRTWRRYAVPPPSISAGLSRMAPTQWPWMSKAFAPRFRT